jgi:hypothetical protein
VPLKTIVPCVKCVLNLLQADLACWSCTEGDLLTCPTCVEKFYRAFQTCTECVGEVVADVLRAIAFEFSRRKPVALVTVTGAEACDTKVHGKGICCKALTQIGEAAMKEGFRYTGCDGKIRCAHCNLVPSTSKKHPGVIVFQYRRQMCGPSGCPALQGITG